jgi:hypothetical protein
MQVKAPAMLRLVRRSEWAVRAEREVEDGSIGVGRFGESWLNFCIYTPLSAKQFNKLFVA